MQGDGAHEVCDVHFARAKCIRRRTMRRSMLTDFAQQGKTLHRARSEMQGERFELSKA